MRTSSEFGGAELKRNMEGMRAVATATRWFPRVEELPGEDARLDAADVADGGKVSG